MNIPKNWQPFAISFYAGFYNNGLAFPQLQRIALNGANPGASISFPVPFRIFGLTLDTTLRSNAAIDPVCVAVVVGQTQQTIAFSQSLQVLAMHNAIPNLATFQTTFVELPPCGLYLEANATIALYAASPTPGVGVNVVNATVALYLAQA